MLTILIISCLKLQNQTVKTMRNFLIPVIFLALLLLPAVMSGENRKEDKAEVASVSSPAETGRKIVDNITGRRFGWRYQKVCTYYGSLVLADALGDKTITEKIIKGYVPYLEGRKKPHMGHVDYNVFGIWPFELFRQTGREEYLAIPQKLVSNEYRELNSEGLSGLSRYWVDDMYMVGSLQVQAYKSLKDTVFLNRAARQLVVYCARLQRENGLFFHREDAPFFWGRGNGWAAAAMTEVLMVLPVGSKYYPPVISAYRKMMKTLIGFQGQDGMWHQLLDDPASYPESSCTGMFVFALATGLERGWLPEDEFRDKTLAGWKALSGYVNNKGEVINVCVGTNAKDNKKHYLTRPRSTGNFHGQAAALWAAAAMIRLEAKKQ